MTMSFRPAMSRFASALATLVCAAWLVGAGPLAAREVARPGLGLAGALVQAAEPAPLTRAWFVSAWETRNVEFGREVRIVWRLWENGRLDYDFWVDGAVLPGSSGTWDWRDGIMHERWERADGRVDLGTGRIERIDDNTLRLTIVDNGDPSYTGKIRIYRRIGPPQTVEAAPAGPRR